MNLEELNYPMFKTTEQEKQWLIDVTKHLKVENGDYYICCALHDYLGLDSNNSLEEKIRKAIYPNSSFLSHMKFPVESQEEKVELRKVWIRKLLAYTGE